MVEEFQKESKEEDVEIDFSKIKNFFVNLKNKFSQNTQEKTESKPTDDLDIDFSKILSFIKNNSTLCILLLLLFLQFMPNYGFLPWGGVWMRMQVEDLPLIDVASRVNFLSNLKSQLANDVNQKYPFLPEDKKKEKIDEEFDKQVSANKDYVDAYVTQFSSQIKDFYRYEANGKKYVYMPDIDPYTFLRRARNLLEKGSLGDELRNGVDWDNHMLAPLGMHVESSLHPYTLFAIHKFFSFFNSQIPLMQSATYFPIIFILLSLFPAFFLGRSFGGNIGGFFTATLVAVHPILMSRTMWGYADTDTYNVFFPLIIIWFFVECFESKEIRMKVLFASLLGLSMGIYSFIWSWWYLFDFILASLASYFVHYFIHRRNFRNFLQDPQIKNALLTSLFVVLFVGVFVTYFLGFSSFISAPLEPLRFQTIKDAAHSNLWPNVYTTVAELNPLDIYSIVNQINSYIFLISILGLILLAFRKYEDTKHHYAILFILWLLATIYATTKGNRFLILTIPSIAVGFGVAVSMISKFLSPILERNFSMNNKITVSVLVIIFSLFLINPVVVSSSALVHSAPLVNDAWWNLLTSIKDNSANDSIITSWWDFGHHFKYIADRRVTFDGATQNTPIAHWVGRVLLSDNEKESVGIMRMLACGSNRAFEEIYKEKNNTLESVNILYSIFQLDKEDARKVLEKRVKDPDSILSLTHCDPPENFLITSDDMIGKSHVWSHFGDWNFEKAHMWLDLRDKNKEEFVQELMSNLNYDKARGEKMYSELSMIDSEDEANFWISDWPSYMSSLGSCAKSEDLFVCNNVLKINGEVVPVRIEVNASSKTTKIFLPSKNNVFITPRYLQYFSDKKAFLQEEYKTYDFDGGILLIPVDGLNFVSLVAPTKLLNSMFTKLYFLEGHGLKNFNAFNKQQQMVGGGYLMVWKVDWNGGESNVMSSLVEKEVVDKDSKILLNYIMWKKSESQVSIIDSSIINWQNNNITINGVFTQKNSNPVPVDLKDISLEKSVLVKLLIGMKKGEEKIFELNPQNSYVVNVLNFSSGNQTVYFKLKVERIS